METSGSEDNVEMQSPPRLGKCEVCNATLAKYTCPKCELKTCCLRCINIHKKELNCDGIRDRTKYIPLKKMSKMDMMNDYYFLEECTRFVDNRKRDKIKQFTRYNKTLPSYLFRLRCAAQVRGTSLRFLLENFSKRQRNTTELDRASQVIYWRVEWCFPNAENLVFVDEKCDENKRLYLLLSKYLDVNGEDIPSKSKLVFYHSRGMNGICVLLKAEGIKRCKNRFFQLDPNKTIKENLKGKTVVEYPSIYVVFKETSTEFDVIESDEDVEAETKLHLRYLDCQFASRKVIPKKEAAAEQEKDLRLLDDIKKLEIAKKREERRKKNEADEPVNLLFSDESLWHLYSSDSEGQVTEEEQEMEEGELSSLKRMKTN